MLVIPFKYGSPSYLELWSQAVWDQIYWLGERRRRLPRPFSIMTGQDSPPIRQAGMRRILARMHPTLRTYFDFVVPLFWPWLVWNLLRLARWHVRSGREALCKVDRFGNIRIVCISDPPPPDGLYTYDAPRVAAWEHPALGSNVPPCVRAHLPKSIIVRHGPDKSGMVMHRHDMVRWGPARYGRGPPWPAFPKSASFTGQPWLCRASALAGAYFSPNRPLCWPPGFGRPSRS